MCTLVIDYAIRFNDGTFYTGKAGEDFKGLDADSMEYTYQGAQNKIERMGWQNLAKVVPLV